MLFCILLTFQMPTIPLEKIDMYKHISIYKTEEAYYFLDRMEGKLVMINSNGSSFTYDKSGRGPKELNAPSFLGFIDNQILILSDPNRVLAFDNELKPNIKSFPRFPNQITDGAPITYGASFNQDKIYLIKGFRHKQMATILSLDKKKWNIEHEFFPQKNPGKMDLNNLSLNAQESYVFKYKNKTIDKYEIEVLKKTEKPDESRDTIMILAGMADRGDVHLTPIFPGQPTRAYVEKAYTIPGGYAVSLAFVEKGSGQFDFTFVADLFDTRGAFIKRIQLGNEMPLIHVINADEEVFIMTEQNGVEVLAPWNPLQVDSDQTQGR